MVAFKARCSGCKKFFLTSGYKFRDTHRAKYCPVCVVARK